ncbi:MAG: phosphatidate cytidylyltransferase, partial [Limibacillus sp.]
MRAHGRNAARRNGKEAKTPADSLSGAAGVWRQSAGGPSLDLPGLVLAVGLLGLGFFVLSVGLGTLALVFRVPVEQGLAALGAMAFGVPYLSLPAASLYQLQQRDPWVLVLLFAIVWLGDTAAYYCGRAWGRRKLAPRVSPNKT